jgi:hypothetical protein
VTFFFLGIKSKSSWEANGENARNTQAWQNICDVATEKHSADILVKPTTTRRCHHVEKILFSDNNWDVVVQKDPEEPMHNPTGKLLILILTFFLRNMTYKITEFN